VDNVLALHREGIKEFGGELGVRDLGLVESAVLASQQLDAHAEVSVCHLAAAYLFHSAIITASSMATSVSLSARPTSFWPSTGST